MKLGMNKVKFESEKEVLAFIELVDFAEREVYKDMRKTLNKDSRFVLQSELSDEIEIFTMLKRVYEKVVGWDYCVEDADFYDIDLVDIEVKSSKEARILCMYVQKMIESMSKGYFDSVYFGEELNKDEIIMHLNSINKKLERIYLVN